jgi:hypothetical protein
MDPQLYQALKGKIQSLDSTATRVTLPEGTSPTTMKNRLLRVAAELNTPITVRRGFCRKVAFSRVLMSVSH